MDREKVIRDAEEAIEILSNVDEPTPWCDFVRVSFERVLELLKEQEPRVLALDEVEDALDTVVWVERPGDENLADGYGLIVMYSHKNGWVCIQRPFGEDPSEDKYDYLAYGKYWRCWSARPTDEQRMEAKWGE